MTWRMQRWYSVLIRTAQFVLQVKWWQAIRYHHVNHHLEEIIAAHIHAEAMHMRDKAVPNQRVITASELSFPNLLLHSVYTALHQARLPRLLFLLRRDLFALAERFGEPCCLWAGLAVARLLHGCRVMCFADVVCVESLGGSTCYLMISSRSDGITAESGLLFPFAMNLSDLSCSCVFHINYTSAAQGKVCPVTGSSRWAWSLQVCMSRAFVFVY